MMCSSGLEFSEIINIILEKLSTDIDHMSIVICIVIDLLPSPSSKVVRNGLF